MDDLIQRVQRVAADRPDPIHILAQMISMMSETDVDPYAVLGMLTEAVAQTLARNIPAERQTETAMAVVQLLGERFKSHGLTGGDS